MLCQLCFGSRVTTVVLRQNQFYSIDPGILYSPSLYQNEPKLNLIGHAPNNVIVK